MFLVGTIGSWSPLATSTGCSWSAVQDWFANLLAHALFQRFPNLRMASIETGSDWVFHLYDKLKKSHSQTPSAYPEDPRETFRRHVWVSPYYEDDLAGLRELAGADHVLMGSDYPLADPSAYIKDLENCGFTAEESKLVMRENGYSLAQTPACLTRQPAPDATVGVAVDARIAVRPHQADSGVSVASRR